MTNSHPLSFKEIPTLTDILAGFPGVSALFFDMDGTLFNTEPHHAKAFIQMGKDHQIRPPFSIEVVHELLVGKADHLVYEIVKSLEGFPGNWNSYEFVNQKNRYLLNILKSSHPEAFFPEKMQKLLLEAKKEKIYLALVTSSEKVITNRLLELAGLQNFFDLELTRDDCPHHKPDPWPYFRAKEISGRESHEILIFEDSHVGLTAASASGSHVIKAEWH
jgi:HAD superfamily hydrolase (TIGR01509 family)